MLDIEAAIKKLKEKGRAGPDNLSPIVMKKCAESLVFAVMDDPHSSKIFIKIGSDLIELS